MSVRSIRILKCIFCTTLENGDNIEVDKKVISLVLPYILCSSTLFLLLFFSLCYSFPFSIFMVCLSRTTSMKDITNICTLFGDLVHFSCSSNRD